MVGRVAVERARIAHAGKVADGRIGGTVVRRSAIDKQQEALEEDKDVRRRLVDRGHDGAPVHGSKACDEMQDAEGRGRVEAGRGLVQEEHAWVRHQLNCNGGALSLATTEVGDAGVGAAGKAQPDDEVVGALDLGGDRERARQAKARRKDQALSHGKSAQQEVVLHHAHRQLPQHRLRRRHAIHEHLARRRRHAARQRVQQRRFAGACSATPATQAHQRSARSVRASV